MAHDTTTTPPPGAPPPGTLLPGTPPDLAPAGDDTVQQCAGCTPVLVTEQEMLFATAAAATPAAPAARRVRPQRALLRVFTGSADRPHHQRPRYPKRYRFLEDACMERAMEQL